MQIIKIKQVEDVLEKYWNDHRMDLSIEYIVTDLFETPFDFFQQFGSFWETQGWSRIGHQLEDLFLRLHQFISQQKFNDFYIIDGIMKWDYLTTQRYKPRKTWWNDGIDKDEKQRLIQTIAQKPELVSPEFQALSLSEKELFKHAAVEKFPFSIAAYLESSEILNDVEYGIVLYNGNVNEQKVYFISKDRFEQASSVHTK